MECNFTETISLLIDGALSIRETAQARNHITSCPECRRAMDEFLGLRETLKAYTLPGDDLSQRRVLNTIFSSERIRLWARRVSVPAPVIALILISFIALGTWSITARVWKAPSTPIATPSATQAGAADRPSTQIGIELSRLDHGGRAVIVKAPKTAGGEAQGNGRAGK
jgi:anti-sigma factor RsiW